MPGSRVRPGPGGQAASDNPKDTLSAKHQGDRITEPAGNLFVNEIFLELFPSGSAERLKAISWSPISHAQRKAQDVRVEKSLHGGRLGGGACLPFRQRGGEANPAPGEFYASRHWEFEGLHIDWYLF